LPYLQKEKIARIRIHQTIKSRKENISHPLDRGERKKQQKETWFS
jgi:hypothetical protein